MKAIPLPTATAAKKILYLQSAATANNLSTILINSPSEIESDALHAKRGENMYLAPIAAVLSKARTLAIMSQFDAQIAISFLSIVNVPTTALLLATVYPSRR